jgi:hypothetical protein
MHVDFSFSYLRFAEAVSFDIKKLRRSCTMMLSKDPYFATFCDEINLCKLQKISQKTPAWNATHVKYSLIFSK